MKFKRLLAVALACCICCMVLVVPAFALPVSSEIDMVNDFSHYITDVKKDYERYKSGEITLNEFFNQTMNHTTTELSPNIVSDILSVKDILRVMEFCGIDVSEQWKAFYSEHNMGGDGSGGNRDDSILNGYGAVCIQKIYSRSNDTVQNTHIYYGNYGIIKDGAFVNIYAPKIICKYTDNSHNADTVIYEYTDVTSIGGAFLNDIYNYAETLFYGDWRYENGDEASDKITELPEKVPPNFDDDSLTDDDLIDFLEDLLNDLQLQYPDLSTIEGLLRAILTKLGTLDSDNDNELLMQILVAIQALKNNGETSDNSELLKMLEDLKSALVFKDDEKTSSLADMLNTLVQNQVRRSDITIDSSLYNQRYALIEAKLLGKFSFISEIKNFVQYAIDSYSKTENSPTIKIDLFNYQHTIDFSAFDSSINLVRWIVAAFVYLSYAFATFRKIPGYINGGDNQ